MHFLTVNVDTGKGCSFQKFSGFADAVPREVFIYFSSAFPSFFTNRSVFSLSKLGGCNNTITHPVDIRRLVRVSVPIVSSSEPNSGDFSLSCCN